MLFNKAFTISANNWKVMLKALICQVLILALVVALCFLFSGDLVEDILQGFQTVEWGKFLSDTFSSIANNTFNGNEFIGRLKDCLEQTQVAIEAIPNVWNRVEISYVTFVLMMILYRMLVSFSDVTVAYQISEFMNSNTARPFTWYLVKKFGTSLRFISLQMLITLPLDIMIVFGTAGLGLFSVVTMRWWVAIPVLLVGIIMYTARQVAFAFWLPVIVTEELGVCKSLTKGVATIPYRFGQVFWKQLVLIIVMTAISTLSVLYVQNMVLKLIVSTVPNLILFFVVKCVNMVEYFEAAKSPYFYQKIDVEGTERYNKKRRRKNK